MKKLFICLVEILLILFSGFIIALAFLNILNWIYNIMLFLGSICILTYITLIILNHKIFNKKITLKVFLL